MRKFLRLLVVLVPLVIQIAIVAVGSGAVETDAVGAVGSKLLYR